jgi:four helix bundle protein
VDSNKGAIVKLSFSFAIKIVKFYKRFIAENREFVLSKQLLRSGTSVGALVKDSQNAESRADFIHKLGIAQKECDETIYWIELLHETEFLKKEEYSSLITDANSLLKMIRSAIITTKKKL